MDVVIWDQHDVTLTGHSELYQECCAYRLITIFVNENGSNKIREISEITGTILNS